MDYCGIVIAVILDGYPIADTGQVNGGFYLEIEFPCQFGRDFPGLISDKVRAAVDCRYARNVPTLLLQVADMTFKPWVETHITQFHHMLQPNRRVGWAHLFVVPTIQSVLQAIDKV